MTININVSLGGILPTPQQEMVSFETLAELFTILSITDSNASWPRLVTVVKKKRIQRACLLQNIELLKEIYRPDDWNYLAGSQRFHIYIDVTLPQWKELSRTLEKGRVEQLKVRVPDLSTLDPEDLENPDFHQQLRVDLEPCDVCIKALRSKERCSDNVCKDLLKRSKLISEKNGAIIFSETFKKIFPEQHSNGGKKNLGDTVKKGRRIINTWGRMIIGILALTSLVIAAYTSLMMNSTGEIISIIFLIISMYLFARYSIMDGRFGQLGSIAFLLLLTLFFVAFASRYWFLKNRTASVMAQNTIYIQTYQSYWISPGDTIPIEIQVETNEPEQKELTLAFAADKGIAEFNLPSDDNCDVKANNDKSAVMCFHLRDNYIQTKIINVRLPVLPEEKMIDTLDIVMTPQIDKYKKEDNVHIKIDVFPISFLLKFRKCPDIFKLLLWIFPNTHVHDTVLPFLYVIGPIILEGLILEGLFIPLRRKYLKL